MRCCHFWKSFIATWLLFIFLLFISLTTKIYLIMPFLSFLGYGCIIIGMLVALYYAQLRCHYIIHSFSLIIFGIIVSLDIILSRGEIAEAWRQLSWLHLNEKNINDYIQLLTVLLNIFTGSLAANTLFYGLTKQDKN